MPHKHTVDDAQKMIFVEGSGTVTGMEIIAILREINDQNFKRHPYNRLWDFRVVSSLEISSADATQIARAEDINDASPKVALVTASELNFGLVRMAANQVFTTVPHVFRDMEQARKWIGLAPL